MNFAMNSFIGDRRTDHQVATYLDTVIAFQAVAYLDYNLVTYLVAYLDDNLVAYLVTWVAYP
jgi:hypothetical protein